LKPANVMLTPEGRIKLVDFGIARLFKPGKERDTQAFGTLGYSAPEPSCQIPWPGNGGGFRPHGSAPSN
jgi:serine/threonine protein kinase